MKLPLRILVLEDDLCDAELMRRSLAAEGMVREWLRADTEPDFIQALDNQRFDLILSDYSLPSFNGMEALTLAREKQPEAPFIFVSGTILEELAVESLKQGATDYVFKNRLSRLVPAVRRALREVEEREESRRAEEAMRQSEHRYRQLFDSLGDAAFLTDARTGRILDTNQQGEALLGLTRGEIIGQNQSRFQAPDKLDEQRRHFSHDDQARPLGYEDVVIRGDGTRVPVNIRVAPLVLYNRRLMIGLYRDITDRKRADEQLEEQGRLLDLDPDAIMVRDLADRIQYWNLGAERLYGWGRKEVLGQLTTTLLYPDRSEFDAAKQAVLERGEWSGELHQLARDGHEVLVRSHWTLLHNAQGTPRSILIVNVDISEKSRNRLQKHWELQ